MKKLILWLAKRFNVSVERTIVKEVVEYRYLTNGTIEGDVFIEGNLTVSGKLIVSGGITLHKKGV